MKDLADWLSWQEQQHPQAIDLGLDRVCQVWEALGSPRPQRVVTVAGTNGKGTTVHALDALARAAKWSTGRYTSPHLYRYNERIVLNGEPVADAVLCAAFERIERAREGVSLTYFEYGTLAASLVFADASVDLAVLEVGLGGRLDATNVVDADIAVLCSISRDHEDWLGSDLAGIAREKAGVARRGRPAILAQPETLSLYGPWLEGIGAEMDMVAVDVRWRDTELQSGLPVHSLAAAYRVAERLEIPVSFTEAQQIFRALRVPGRMECRAADFGEYLLDVAHNEAAAKRLARCIGEMPVMRNVLIIGMQSDKDRVAVAAALAPVVDKVFACQLPPPRGASSRQMADAFEPYCPSPEYASPELARIAAEEWARTSGAPVRIIIAGSFVTVGSCGLG